MTLLEVIDFKIQMEKDIATAIYEIVGHFETNTQKCLKNLSIDVDVSTDRMTVDVFSNLKN